MLVDIVVRAHEVVAAKPSNANAVPIILVSTEWVGHESYNCNERLLGRTWGRLRGAALQEAMRVVNNNGSLSEAGEYGSMEIHNSQFVPDSKLQEQIEKKIERESSELDNATRNMVKRMMKK